MSAKWQARWEKGKRTISPPNLSPILGLTKGGREGGAIAETATATAGEAAVGTILGSRLGSGGAVEEFIVGHARVTPVTADKDTGVHVGGTLGPGDAHGVLAPCVHDLAIVGRRIGVDGRPRADGARGKADDLAGARRDLDGDERLVHVDPRRVWAPDGQDQVLAGSVGEVVGISASTSNPDAAIVRVRIDTRLA